MAAFNPIWTPGYDQYGCYCWYNKATGRTFYPSPADEGDQHRREQDPQQGLSISYGHQVGLCDVAQPGVPTGSYFNPPTDMTARGVSIQPAREDGAQKQRHGELAGRRATLDRPRDREETKLSPQAPPGGRTPTRQTCSSRPVVNPSMPPPATVEVFRRPLPQVRLSNERRGRSQRPGATGARLGCNVKTGQSAYERPAFLANVYPRRNGFAQRPRNPI